MRGFLLCELNHFTFKTSSTIIYTSSRGMFPDSKHPWEGLVMSVSTMNDGLYVWVSVEGKYWEKAGFKSNFKKIYRSVTSKAGRLSEFKYIKVDGVIQEA